MDELKKEIDKRLKSDNWNNLIAKKIIFRKRKKQLILRTGGLAFSLGMLMLILGYIFILDPANKPANILLINKQITGIQNEVYQKNDFELIPVSTENSKDENIDSFIISTLSHRN